MAIDPLLYFFPELKNVSMTSLQTKFTVVFITCLFFLIVYLLSFVGSYLFVTSFLTKLRPKERVFWSLAFVRSVFGVSGTVVALWYFFMDDILKNDVVNGSNITSFIASYVALGFYIFELMALLASNVYFKFFDSFLFFHHFVSFLGCFVVTFYGSNAHFFIIVGLLLEVTTPFSCLCWMLLKCEMSDHLIWKINQLILVHLFHCRTTIEGYAYYSFLKNWAYIGEEMPLLVASLLFVHINMNFFILTPYWTYKKMTQLYKPVDWNHPEILENRTTTENGGIGNGINLSNNYQTHNIAADELTRDPIQKNSRKRKGSKRKVQ